MLLFTALTFLLPCSSCLAHPRLGPLNNSLTEPSSMFFEVPLGQDEEVVKDLPCSSYGFGISPIVNGPITVWPRDD